MANEKKKDALAQIPDELGILDPKYVEKTLDAISKISAVVKAKLHKGHDYGVIPGTQKPTLLKPGAEKMVKLFGLADTYEVMEQELNWDKPFFFFQIKCSLRSMRSGNIVSEGMGNCNSMEDRFRWRWLWPNELSAEHMDDEKKPLETLKTKQIHSKKHDRWYTQYRVENDNIHTLVNTILKMGEKRALTDAVLHATRLSDLFTQDMEDIYQGYVEEVKEEEKETKEPTEKPKSKPKEKPAEKPPEDTREESAKSFEPEYMPSSAKKSKKAKDPKEDRADTGEELGIDKEGQPVEEETEVDIMATDDQKNSITGMLGTLTDTYKRDPEDLVRTIHERLVTKFGEVRAKIPDDLTREEANFVMKGLDSTIKKEHKIVEDRGKQEEPPEEF